MRKPISGTEKKAVIDPKTIINKIEGTDSPRAETPPTPPPPKKDGLISFIEALVAFLRSFLARAGVVIVLLGPMALHGQNTTPLDTTDITPNWALIPGITAGLELLNRATKEPPMPIQEAKGKRIMAKVARMQMKSAKQLNEALEKGQITPTQYILNMKTLYDMTPEEMQLLMLEAQNIRANAKKKK